MDYCPLTLTFLLSPRKSKRLYIWLGTLYDTICKIHAANSLIVLESSRVSLLIMIWKKPAILGCTSVM